MPDRTIAFGESVAAARYQTRDSSASGGDFEIVRDLDNAILALQYNFSAQQVETGVPLDTDTIQFRNANEDPTTVDPATGTVTVDIASSNWYDPIAATENITVAFSNVASGGNSLTLRFTDGDAMGPYTITWPASVEWPNGNATTEIPASGDVEIFLLSPDGGTTWRARRGGRNFA